MKTTLLTTRLRDLLKREPVMAPASCSIQEAAQHMARAGVSSLLLMQGDTLAGIMTDRDLRNRVLAAELSPELPVAQVMTPHPRTIPAQANALEATMMMIRHNIHHLPLEDSGRIVGLVTTTDLLRQQSASPVYLVGEIRKQQDVTGLQTLSQQIPTVLTHFVDAHVPARDVGYLISTITDALTEHLLTLAEAVLGPAPLAYAWLALGSQARQEQSSHSDQDNALLLASPPTPPQEEYFQRLAQFVSDGLHACGFVYCPGNVMATNPRWRQPLSQWQTYFQDWIEEPDPEALLNVSIFFDIRAIRDPQQLLPDLRRQFLKQASGHHVFLAHMARNALTFRPPLGFFRQFILERRGDHANTFDIKHRGLTPIVDLARVTSLAHGLDAINTYQRLEQAQQQGHLHTEDATNLLETFAYLSSLRLRHHAKLIRQQRPADNHIAPGQLSSMERRHLRDAFKLVQTSQAALAMRYQTDMLG